MKFLALLLSLAAFAASAAEPLPPARYSFNDVYRLTVGQSLNAPWPAQAEAPLRVALLSATPATAEPSFTVRQLPAPQRWLLLLAGLALAGWVAHRRLSYL